MSFANSREVAESVIVLVIGVRTQDVKLQGRKEDNRAWSHIGMVVLLNIRQAGPPGLARWPSTRLTSHVIHSLFGNQHGCSFLPM